MSCHSVRSFHCSSFFQRVFVARERWVRVTPAVVCDVSASAPRKPMSSTLLRYMVVGSLFEILGAAHYSRASALARNDHTLLAKNDPPDRKSTRLNSSHL